MVPKYSKRYEDANLSLSNNMDDCYRTLSSHVKQNKVNKLITYLEYRIILNRRRF